jgi:hypothetical protein
MNPTITRARDILDQREESDQEYAEWLANRDPAAPDALEHWDSLRQRSSSAPLVFKTIGHRVVESPTEALAQEVGLAMADLADRVEQLERQLAELREIK